MWSLSFVTPKPTMILCNGRTFTLEPRRQMPLLSFAITVQFSDARTSFQRRNRHGIQLYYTLLTYT